MSEQSQVRFQIKTWHNEIVDRQRKITMAERWLLHNPEQTIETATENIKNKVKIETVGQPITS